jgi:hypothetical protein
MASAKRLKLGKLCFKRKSRVTCVICVIIASTFTLQDHFLKHISPLVRYQPEQYQPDTSKLTILPSSSAQKALPYACEASLFLYL